MVCVCAYVYSSREYVCLLSLFKSCPTLWDPMDCSPPGSSVQIFSSPEHWSGFPCLFQGIFPTRDQTHISYICIGMAGGFFTTAAAAAKSLQSCPTLCDPVDGSPSGSPIPGILQARTLEWVAISFSNA